MYEIYEVLKIMKYYFILNPAAGKNRKALSMIPDIQKICEKHKLDYRIHISKSGKDITQFVQQTASDGGSYRFYAFGGDGTLNDLINGCIGCENREVGVFPMGTGNDFVKNFDIDEKDFFDIENQLFAESIKVDTIKAGDKHCINMCNIGFDANIGLDMPKFKKLPFVSNHAAYGMSVAYNLMKKLGRPLKIYADDRPLLIGDTLMCAVANGVSCGGGFYVTPKARITDGLIDVSAVITPPSPARVPLYLKHFLAATQLDAKEMKPYIRYTRCKKVRIIAPKPFSMVNDGEGETQTDITFEICPSSVNFILPGKD